MKTATLISFSGVNHGLCMILCFVILFCASQVSAQDLPAVLREEAASFWEEGNSHLERRDPVAAREAFHKALAALNIKVQIHESGLTSYDTNIDPLATDQEMAGIILQRMEQLERVIAGDLWPAIYPREVHALNGFAASKESIALLENVRTGTSYLAIGTKLRIGKLLRSSYNGAIYWADLLQLVQKFSKERAKKISLPDVDYSNYAFLCAEGSRSRLLLDLFEGMDQIRSDRLLQEWYIRFIITSFLTWTRETAVRESAISEPFNLEINEDLFYRRHELLQTETEKLYSVQRSINAYRPGLLDNLQIRPTRNLYLSEIQKGLGPREAILEYHLTESDVYIFVVKSYGNVVLETAERQVSEVKRTAEKYSGILSSKKERPWHRESKRLYRDLIEPIRHAIRNIDRLIIVPNDVLHAIPLQTLMDPATGRLLLDDFSIRYLPSASFLRRSTGKKTTNGKAMILAIKDFTDSPSLEHSRSEARSVASFFGDRADLFLDSNGTANKEDFLKNAQHYEIIHISSHGQYDLNDPILSYIVFKGPKGVDTNMSAYEILVQNLSARLVVLSACETYFRAGAVITSGEDVFGIPQTFLLAGAQNILASLWKVNEVSTSVLMSQFYSFITDPAPSTLDVELRKAQINLKRKYPHPYNWAPFVLYGYSD